MIREELINLLKDWTTRVKYYESGLSFYNKDTTTIIVHKNYIEAYDNGIPLTQLHRQKIKSLTAIDLFNHI